MKKDPIGLNSHVVKLKSTAAEQNLFKFEKGQWGAFGNKYEVPVALLLLLFMKPAGRCYKKQSLYLYKKIGGSVERDI